MKTKTIITLVVSSICFCTHPVCAQFVTVGFSAEVYVIADNGPSAGYLEGKVNLGDIITGTYTYDFSVVDSDPSPVFGIYANTNLSCGIFASVNGLDFRTDSTNANFLMTIINDNDGINNNYYSGDGYCIESFNNLPLSNGSSVDRISWILDDPDGTALLNDFLPLTPPVLENWRSKYGLFIQGEDEGFRIEAQVITVTLIPEPASFLLLALGAVFIRKAKHANGGN